VWPTDPLNNNKFLACAVMRLNILEILRDTSHIVAINICTMETWGTQHFSIPVGRLSVQKQAFHTFARLRNPD